MSTRHLFKTKPGSKYQDHTNSIRSLDSLPDMEIQSISMCFDSRFQIKFGLYETYTPVARYPSVRTILALGGKFELGDMSNIFLNSKVDADVFESPSD